MPRYHTQVLSVSIFALLFFLVFFAFMFYNFWVIWWILLIYYLSFPFPTHSSYPFLSLTIFSDHFYRLISLLFSSSSLLLFHLLLLHLLHLLIHPFPLALFHTHSSITWPASSSSSSSSSSIFPMTWTFLIRPFSLTNLSGFLIL